MPTIHFTDRTLAALKNTAKRTIYWDDALPNFGIRVGLKSKTFIVVPRQDRAKITLGHYPHLSLQDARYKAKKLLLEPVAPSTVPLGDAFTTYEDTYITPNYRKKSAYQVNRIINRHIKHLFHKPISKLEPSDFTILFSKLPPSQANHLFAALRTFLNWAERNNYGTNPLTKLSKPAKEKSRSRTLTDDELKRIWNACPDTTFGRVVKMLILTGQRLGETAAIETSWIRETNLTFPAHITKNGEEHTIPLAPNAQSLIAEALSELAQSSVQLDDTSHSKLIFPSPKTGRVFIGWGKLKAQLEKDSGVTDWTLHDLRRTFSTIHARLGTPPHVTEALLNHKTGTRTPIQRIYDRHNYLPQMKDAIERYDAWLSSLLSAP